MKPVLNIVEDLKSLFIGVFGPKGVSVLIQESNGAMRITRSGWVVIQSVYDESTLEPASKMYLECVKKVHTNLGDGVKSFVILFSAMMKNLLEIKGQGVSSTFICTELLKFVKSLSEIRGLSQDSVPAGTLQYNIKVTSALFYTSCSSSVSIILQDIFHKWLNSFNMLDVSKPGIGGFEFLCKYFSILCPKNHTGSQSVSDSYVLHGFLVDRPAINIDKSNDLCVKIVLYIPDSKDNDNFLESEVTHLIKNSQDESDTHRILLVTSAVLPSLIIFMLKQKNILILHSLSHDIVEFINSFLQKNKSQRNVIIKSYILGSRECTWLKLEGVHQLIIHAPTEAVKSEFWCICKRALRFLKAINSQGIPGLLKAGGTFEKLLHFHLLANLKGTKQEPNTFGVSSRAELLLWHSQKQLIAQHNKKLSTLHSNSVKFSDKGESNDSFNISELNIATEIPSDKKCPDYDNHFFNISDIAKVCQVIDGGVLKAVAQSLLAIPGQLKLQNTPDDVYEPISFKMALILQVVGALISFFRCEFK